MGSSSPQLLPNSFINTLTSHLPPNPTKPSEAVERILTLRLISSFLVGKEFCSLMGTVG